MKEHTNILFISHFSSLGGAEKHLISLISNLNSIYNPFLLCQERGSLAEAAEQFNIKMIYYKLPGFRKLKNFFLNRLALNYIEKICREKTIQIICSHCYRVTPFAVLISKRMNLPCITLVQDFVPNEKLNKFLVFDSDIIVTVSESISKSIRPFYSKSIYTIYNHILGKDLNVPKEDIKKFEEQYKISVNCQYIIGMVANIIPQKAHELFLDAMSLVSNIFDNARFVIVGDAFYEKSAKIKALKKYAKKLGIGDKVIFTGFVNNVAAAISCMDILVHPAHKEPFGRVITEAMLLGIPVVATRSGGPSEIIEGGKSGLLVNCNDKHQIADAVCSLLKDKNKMQLFSREGKKRILEQFNKDKTVKKFNDVIEELLGHESK